MLSLSAVTVLTGDILMQRVFDHLITNYEMEATRLTSYYKEKLTTQDSLVYLAEGILDILSPPNIGGSTTKISPLRTRKVVLQKLDPERATMMSGHAYDMIKSSIWRENSFLSKSNRKHYRFEYEGKKPYQKHSVYEVSFTPKDNKGYVSGKLFIEDETYAIIKMIYEPKTTSSNFWDSVKWTEEFEFVNGRFNLTTVSYKGEFAELGKTYIFNSLLINNNITDSSPIPTPEDVMSRNDIFVEKADYDFTEDFWSGYNFIKLTTDESSF